MTKVFCPGGAHVLMEKQIAPFFSSIYIPNIVRYIIYIISNSLYGPAVCAILYTLEMKGTR